MWAKPDKPALLPLSPQRREGMVWFILFIPVAVLSFFLGRYSQSPEMNTGRGVPHVVASPMVSQPPTVNKRTRALDPMIRVTPRKGQSKIPPLLKGKTKVTTTKSTLAKMKLPTQKVARKKTKKEGQEINELPNPRGIGFDLVGE